jgi:hypothetical protein
MDQQQPFKRRIKEFKNGISLGSTSRSLIKITKQRTEPDSIPPIRANAWPSAIWGKDNNQPQLIITPETLSVAKQGFIVQHEESPNAR